MAETVVSDVKVWPLHDQTKKLKAMASCVIFDEFCITGLKVIETTEKQFVSMPQNKGSDNEYHDICFPMNGNLRKEIEDAVLIAYNNQAGEKKEGRGRGKN